MSDYEDRYERVLAALAACDGCCLDNEEERVRVAREVVRRVWGQEDLDFWESRGLGVETA